MQNAITYALNEIKSRIPMAILELAFLRGQPNNCTLEEILNESVIQNYVLVDCGITGGKTKHIILLHSYVERVLNPNIGPNQFVGDYSVYRIPAEARENSNIQSIVNVSYGYISSGGYNGIVPSTPGLTVAGLAHEVMRSHSMDDSPPLPIASIWPGNILRLDPPQHVHIDWDITCKLSYDSNMTSAGSQSIIPFSKLVLYKTQMIIYNNLVVWLDKGLIEGGSEIGVIKDIIDGYTDASEKYDEALMEWRGSNYLDTRSKITLFQYMM